MIKLSVKVVPRAANNEIVGWLNGALKVRVAAAPQQGQANEAVEALLAGALGLRRGQVRVSAGHASARKSVEIQGIDQAELNRLLPPA